MTTPEQQAEHAGAGGLLDLVVLPDRLPESPQPSIQRAIGAFLLWGLVGQVVPFLPRSAHRTLSLGQPLLPPLAGAAYGLALAAAFVLWFAVRQGAHADYRRDTFRLRALPPAALAWLPLVALPLIAATLASLVLVPRFIPVPAHKDTFIDWYVKLPHGIVTLLVMTAVVAPLLEEFLFRGWIQRRLERRLPPARAILLAAAIFSAAHFELFGFPTRLMFGAVAGYAAWSTRSIWPGVVLHGMYNATLIGGGGTTGRDVSEADLTRWAHTPSVFWPALLVFLLAALLLVAALRGLERAARTARLTDRT